MEASSNMPGTVMHVIPSITARNLSSMSFISPSAQCCITNFQYIRTRLVAPFRLTAKGIIVDLLDPDVTQSHNPKRLFDLVDPGGAYIKCVAMVHNSISQALVNQQEVILYFGTGRGIGAQPGMLYLMKEAAIFTAGGKKLLPSPKKELIEIS